jgi:hypothetical protein
MLTLIGADPGLALDANAAAGRIAGALHRGLSLSAASEGPVEPWPEMAKAARCSEAALWKRNSVAARVTRTTTNRLCAQIHS